MIRYCIKYDNFIYLSKWYDIRQSLRKTLFIYYENNVLYFTEVEKFLDINKQIEEKYKQHLKRKIKLLTIKNKNIK
jgi:hypothetical protein